MKIELKRLQRDVGVTTIYVTHDQEEALTMSDRVAVMRAGRVEQVGAPREIYETPAPSSWPASSATPTCSPGAAAAAPPSSARASPSGGGRRPVGRRAGDGRGAARAHPSGRRRPARQRGGGDGRSRRLPGRDRAISAGRDGGLELQAVELGRVRFPAGSRVRASWAAADAHVLSS